LQCIGCSLELKPEFSFCPKCGKRAQSIEVLISLPASKVPDRYLVVIREFETLTNTKLTQEEIVQFAELPAVGALSVNESSRRMKSGSKIRTKNEDGTFDLNIFTWLQELYETPNEDHEVQGRVWITTKGGAYHSTRDCRGLVGGQHWAASRGLETYKPQFVTYRDAQHRLGYTPCEICKPD
jgi:hypothetical protein